ncbi:MAG: hypothetical protein JO353_04660 [Phycisphaerae bacterium]|nr:hypothetical protein [Phycisphaerae bacterium]
MTKLLQQAVSKTEALSLEEQDAIARMVIAEIDSDRHWDELFAKNPEKLTVLADKAWAEHVAGETEPLEPDQL